MAQTIKYIGAQDNWFEVSVTGRQSNWQIGQQEERADTEAALLLATGLFEQINLPFLRLKTNPLTGGIEVFGMVVVPGLVADNVAAAATNTAKLQAALDTGGNIFVGEPGEIYINATLRIGDHTNLKLSPLTTIKLAPLTNGNMITTKAFAVVPSSVVITWAAGTTASVAWVGHPFSYGDYASLEGANQSAFRGVFVVNAVTDANNFVVTLMETPIGVATGTTKCRKANVNFSIDGGTWDYDYANNTAGNPGYTYLHAAIIAHAACFSASNMRYSHVPKFLMVVGAVRDYEITRQHAIDGGEVAGAHNGDIVKVYGPSFNGRTGFLTGRCVDDGVSLQTEEPAAYALYNFVGGAIIGHKIDSISMDAGTIPVAIYAPPVGKTWTMTGIEIDGMFATVDSGAAKIKVAADPAAVADTASIGTISIHNVNLTGNEVGNLLIVEPYVLIKTLTVGQCRIDDLGIPTNADAIMCKGKINTLTVRDSYFKGLQSAVGTNLVSCAIGTLNVENCVTQNTLALVGLAGGDIGTINVDGNRINGSGSLNYGVYVLGVTTLGVLNLIGNYLDSGTHSAYRNDVSATTNPQINLIGNRIDGPQAVYSIHNCSFFMQGNKFLNAYNGILRAAGTAVISLTSGGGNILTAGAWLAFPSGTPTVSLFGHDIKADVGLTNVLRTAGSYCFNNGAARGTLVQNNLVTCDATGAANSWHQNTAPTNVF